MSLPVHWVPTLAGVRPGQPVEVEGDEAHHAVVVRRLRTGERLVLTDGLGTSVTGTVVETGKRRLVVTADELTSLERPEPSFAVVQALPKGDRGELAVEMLTEVGASTVVPWAATRSVAVWRGDRGTKALTRWRSTSREAAKQARRAWFPEVDDLATTGDVAERIGRAAVAVILHEDATTSLAAVEVPESGEVVVVVGPEGGLTDDEVAAFTTAGGHAVRLGSEVLRTSTAGVAAVSALLARSPRWQ
jgi:16S rRNA (uracil1498-N3)-methyltransferase